MSLLSTLRSRIRQPEGCPSPSRSGHQGEVLACATRNVEFVGGYERYVRTANLFGEPLAGQAHEVRAAEVADGALELEDGVLGEEGPEGGKEGGGVVGERGVL